MSESYELVKFVDGSFELEVNVSPEEDTVWLTKKDLSLLFNRERTVISRHISNIFTDGECDRESNVRFMHVANSDKPVEAYNLDVVIAVGYRVKSLRGVIFRKWATSVLRQYMLKGFAVEPSRVLVSRENYLDLVNVVNRIDSTQSDLVGRVERLEDKYPEFGMRIFFKGQLYDASSCIEGILEQAEREILLIDGLCGQAHSGHAVREEDRSLRPAVHLITGQQDHREGDQRLQRPVSFVGCEVHR